MSHLLAGALTEALPLHHAVGPTMAFNVHPRTEGTAQVKSRRPGGAQVLGVEPRAERTPLLMDLLLASYKG